MTYSPKPEPRKLSEKGGKYVYTVRNLAGGKPRVVGQVYLDSEGRKWCAEMGPDLRGLEIPYWDARGKRTWDKATFAHKKEAVTKLLETYEAWRLKNEATPADLRRLAERRLAEQAYTAPRDRVATHTQAAISTMGTIVKMLENSAAFLKKALVDFEDEAKKLDPDPILLAEKAQHFTRNALHQLSQVTGGGALMTLTDNQAKVIGDHAVAQRARATLPPERAKALDEQALTAKATKRLVRKT